VPNFSSRARRRAVGTDTAPMSEPEMDPRKPDTLYAEGPVAEAPPDDDLPETSPLRDSGGTGPGPDDLDRLT
jgi:hypothetical protein